MACGDKTCKENVDRHENSIAEIFGWVRETPKCFVKWSTFWKILTGLCFIVFVMMSSASWVLYREAKEAKAESQANKDLISVNQALIIEMKTLFKSLPDKITIAVQDGIRQYDKEAREKKDMRRHHDRYRIPDN